MTIFPSGTPFGRSLPVLPVFTVTPSKIKFETIQCQKLRILMFGSRKYPYPPPPMEGVGISRGWGEVKAPGKS